MAKANNAAADKRGTTIDVAALRPPYTVAEWCAKRKHSYPTFWNHQRLGIGPRLAYEGAMPRITAEAEAEYEKRLNAGELALPGVRRRRKPLVIG